jgi:hypothetical protein
MPCVAFTKSAVPSLSKSNTLALSQTETALEGNIRLAEM